MTPSPIVDMFNAGSTVSAIAAELGVKHGTVSSHLRRARERGEVTRAPDMSRSRYRGKTARTIDGAPMPVSVAVDEFAMPRWPLVDGPQPLLTAPLFTCRGVVGRDDRGDLYCCRPKVRGSRFWYCAEHMVR